jgi:hypothetical protein
VKHQLQRLFAVLGLVVALALPSFAQDDSLPGSDVLMKALADELARSMTLKLEDLATPYFIQYDVSDSINYTLSATYGAIVDSDRTRGRTLNCQVRVGSYELDNTNFAESGLGRLFGGRRGGGSRAGLPLDDDYMAIRQIAWLVTDGEYKGAVETLTQKQAYLRDKNIADRPNDYTPADPVEHLDPPAVLEFDRAAWEENLKQLSARFKEYPQVQDSGVRLYVGAGNSYLVNSEGTRLRTADTGVLLLVSARVQCEDGMRISDSRSYTGLTVADLPPMEQLSANLDEMVAGLTASMEAPSIDFYAGPVLFDGVSAPQVFRSMLADGLAAKPDPVGERRRSRSDGGSLETKLGARVLPKSWKVWDNPTTERQYGKVLLGHYKYDEEGVPAQHVDLVVDGRLKTLCASRAPTQKLTASNGHARRGGGGGAQAAVGCLFLEDEDGLSVDDLKMQLIEAARDEGLEFGVRVESIRSAEISSSQSDLIAMLLRGRRGGGGGGPRLGDPVLAYKVFVEDGHEEPFRGCEFGDVDVSELKDILAAGDSPVIYNYIGVGMRGTTPPTTIVAPPVLFEELELSRIQEEYDKPPILHDPIFRK